MREIADWLAPLGLAEYATVFDSHGIDLDVLPDLTDHDFEKLGVLVGHRRKMQRTIAESGIAAHARPKPSEPPRSAERRHMTVMFCDLVGSTALASRLDPEDMSTLIRSFQDACVAAVARYEGFVAKFMGDGVLVYFGHPRADEGDAERAVRAGMEIVAAIASLRTPGAIRLEIRIGIATGLVVVGEVVGHGAAREQSVVGSTPNLAARLQSLAQPGTIVIAAATRRLLGDLFALRPLGPQELKGLAEPVDAWVVEGVSASEMRFDAVRSNNLTAFVGRESEAEVLEGLRRLAWQGSGQIVLISGEPGIGKSRFVRQFSERLVDLPHTRLRYQCSPFHTASALYPFIEQMKRSAGFDPDDSADVQLDKLAALVARAGRDEGNLMPVFASLLSVPSGMRYPPHDLNASELRQRTFAAVLDHMEALSRAKPILSIVEDVHWADATSLEVLELAAERIRRRPVLMLVTCRPEFEPPWIGLDNVRVMTLGRLDRPHVRAMINSIASAKSIPDEVADQIVAKTDGVPLFVEELTKMVLESDPVVEEAGGFRLDGPLPPLAIPETLQASLMARLDRVAFVKDVAQIGAAIGREFSYSLLCIVAGRDRATLDAALQRLECAQLLFRTGSPTEVRYRFKHALVQNAAYESLLKSRRQVLHRRIAETLRDQFPQIALTEPEIVGHHFARAGLDAAASEWWRNAAESALARSAHVEAITHYANAIKLAETLPDTPEQRLSRLHLQIAYGQALIAAHSHGTPLAVAAFDRAAELAATIEHSPERVRVYYGLWGSHHVRGSMPTAWALADTMVRASSRDPNSPEAALGHRALATTYWSEGNLVAARSHLEQALAIGGGDAAELRIRFGLDPEVAAVMQLAVVLLQLGESERARQLAADGLRLAVQSRHVPTLAYGHGWTCLLEAVAGNGSRVLPSAEALVELSGEHRLSLFQSFATFFLDWARWRTGDRSAGRERMRRVVNAFRAEGLVLYLTFYPVLLAEVEAEAGELDSAWSTLEEAIGLTERTGQRWFSSEAYRLRGELILRRTPAERAGARAAFARALTLARQQQARIAESRAEELLSRLYASSARTATTSELIAIPRARIARRTLIPA